MEREKPQAIFFNGFTLDLARGRLLRGDLEVKLRPKSFEVLRYLIENHGRLIGKEELIGSVWVDAAVTDNSLSQCLIELRRALGDDSQTIIRNVPRRGYIFDIPVSGDSGAGELQVETVNGQGSPATVISKPTARRLLPLTALGIVAALLCVVAFNPGGIRQRLPGWTSAPAIRSLVVLPLEGLSSEPDLDYFADGMTDALITDLAQIQALRVISRTTAMMYKKARKPLPQIARELNVDAAVEGTAVRSGGRVRITTQLVLAREDKHIWARSYERDLQDILALQDEVARDIAEQIKIQVTPRERSRLASAPRVNPDAYEAYLESRYFVTLRGAVAARKSLEYARKAAALQPDSALFEASLSDSLISMSMLYAASPRDVLPQAIVTAQKAIQIDDSLAEGHTALGKAYFNYDWNFPAAEREFKRALQLKPNLEDTHQIYGFFLSAMGRHSEAIAEMRRARDLDPLSPWQNRNVGCALYYARRYDEAVEQFKKTAELNPNFPAVYNWLGWLYSAKGMDAEAAAWQLKNMAVNPSPFSVSPELVAKNGPQALWRKQLEDSNKLGPSRTYANAAYNVAAVAARLGKNGEAFQYLERAFDERSFWMPFLNVDPLFDSLHADPRFRNLLGRIGLRN
jgi:TolB-like protein/DNA-binding winged helix-turn-helix (wHTH) protein/Flp pilus assembly protein TadD